MTSIKTAPVADYRNTARRYSFLWERQGDMEAPKKCHFDSMQEVIPEAIVRGSIGLDLGCGCGWDTFTMARNNPSVRIIGMDVSDGVHAASRLNYNMKNAIIVRSAASDIPLGDAVCDFVYSFGVLHHMRDYKRGLLEISRVLKKGGASFLYLYEDHRGNLLKHIAVRLITMIRKVTVKIPPRALYLFACAISPVTVLLFSYPAKIFKRYKSTYHLYEKMPFNFGTSPLSLRADLYDRLAAPVEVRFSRKALYEVFSESGFSDIRVTKLRATAGWVVCAYRKG